MFTKIRPTYMTHCRANVQQARDADPMSFYCWATVIDGGSTLNQHLGNVLCRQVYKTVTQLNYPIVHYRKSDAFPFVGKRPEYFRFIRVFGILGICPLHCQVNSCCLKLCEFRRTNRPTMVVYPCLNNN